MRYKRKLLPDQWSKVKQLLSNWIEMTTGMVNTKEQRKQKIN